MRSLFVLLVFVSCMFVDISQLYYNFRNAQDSESGANITEDFAHYKRHSGMSFEIEDTITLDNGDSCQFAIRACGADTFVHVIFDINISAATKADFIKTFQPTALTALPILLLPTIPISMQQIRPARQ